MVELTIVVVKGDVRKMTVKMRSNNDVNAICCSCGDKQNQVLNMFDLSIGGNVLTICDECNAKLFKKCLSAECMKNGRVKSQKDMQIISKRKAKLQKRFQKGHK